MSPLITQYVATARQAREADHQAIDGLKIPSLILMENAAQSVCRSIQKHDFSKDAKRILIVCGPGNNGADGLACARILLLQNRAVRVFVNLDTLSGDGKIQLQALAELAISNACSLTCLFVNKALERKGQLWRFDAGAKTDAEKPDDADNSDKETLENLKTLDRNSGENSEGAFAAYGLDRLPSQIVPLLNTLKEEAEHADLLVDALFGNGLNRTLQAPFCDYVNLLNKAKTPIVSIDVPSGIDGTTGKVLGSAIRADLTVALDCLKWGLLLNNGPAHAGSIEIADIGIPAFLHEKAAEPKLFTRKDALEYLPRRSNFSHKGTFGKLLLCGGSARMQGAICMSAKAAFSSGCGTLTLFTPKDAAKAIAAKMDLAMILRADQDAEGWFAPGSAKLLSTAIDRCDVIGAGNGMGTGLGAQEVVQEVLKADRPCVLDADAINILSLDNHIQWLDAHDEPIILTPHLMEFARLVHAPLEQIESDPLTLAQDFCAKHPQVTLVLKSDFTLVCSQNSHFVIHRPDSALAKGGSGDALCGIISGLLSAGLKPDQAAVLGAWIHNESARAARSPWSFSPEKLIDALEDTFHSLECEQHEADRSVL